MQVFRGRESTPTPDRERSDTIVSRAATTETESLRVWRPPEQIAFGRRDVNRPGYDRAQTIAEQRAIPTVERSTGGHAVYFTGNTVSVLHAIPIEDSRSGIETRYERALKTIQNALADLGVRTQAGEPDGAFCPGTHSLSASGKIVGLAQRIRSDVAVVAAIIVVSDHDRAADVLDPVYDTLDIPFDPAATGSIARAGGPSSPHVIIDALVSQFSRPTGSTESD